MKRNELREPVTMTDKYFYDMAISLRILVDMFSELANGQQEFAVERVQEETIGVHSVEEFEEYEKSTLENMTVSELRHEAKSLGAKNVNKMNKDKLITYLIEV